MEVIINCPKEKEELKEKMAYLKAMIILKAIKKAEVFDKKKLLNDVINLIKNDDIK